MADLGFPRGEGANSPGGAPTYNFAKFSQKLHEIERIWRGGGTRLKFYYVDPPLIIPLGGLLDLDRIPPMTRPIC